MISTQHAQLIWNSVTLNIFYIAISNSYIASKHISLYVFFCDCQSISLVLYIIYYNSDFMYTEKHNISDKYVSINYA